MSTRRTGLVLIACGFLAIAYTATVVFWRDPATDLYSRYQQERLESALEEEFAAWTAAAPPRAEPMEGGEEFEMPDPLISGAATARDARLFTRGLEQGQAFGRIEIPGIGVAAVVVHGTRWGADLSRGPGHYEKTEVPGLGKTVGIAGHRTTFGAPFRNIDDIDVGDRVILEMPYATFRYRVFEHEVVDADDWTVIRDRGFETIMLSACHPLYSARQRWIVYGRLIEVRSRAAPASPIDS